MTSPNMPGGQQKARTWVVVVALVVGSSLVGAWLASIDLKPAFQVPNAGQDLNPASQPKRPTADVTPAVFTGQARRVLLEPLPEGPVTSGGASAPLDNSTTDLLVIRCNSVDGKGLADVKIRGLARRSSPGSTEDPPKQFEVSTTQDGTATIVDVVGCIVRLESAQETWFWNPVEVFVAKSGQVTVVASPSASIRIHAMYDDGLPVTYMGSLHSADFVTFSATFGLSESGTAVVPGIPVDQPLTCLIFAQARSGYERHQEVISAHDLASGAELQIVVMRSGKQRGNIRVDFEGEPNPRRCIIQMERQGDTPTTEDLNANARRWDSPPLRPGKWRLTVVGKSAWKSDWIEVSGGETTTVKAVLQPAGSVRARLVNSSGTPLVNGALCESMGRYLAYQAGNPPSPSRDDAALSDESGMAILQNLAPGIVEIEAEAWGYQPLKRTVRIEPGQLTEIGDITLLEATGEITVRLEGMKAGLDYVVIVMQPGLGQLRPDLPVASNSETLQGLPLKRYRVGVTLAKSGTIVAETVELTADQPSKTILIDVSSVRP